MDSAGQQNCDCVICKEQTGFKLSSDLLDDLFAKKLTIFAGAGVSTESRNVLNFTLYDSIANEVNAAGLNLSFPDLMQKFENQPNGRIKLLTRISDRLSHVDSFPELQRSATRFHRELGTLHQVQNIITTNWDTYFERACHATPFVEDSDMAFWEAAKRRVLKLHGSISNFGSIVATTTDYAKCKTRLQRGIVGSQLKSILATQTVVFIGYSMSDSDFKDIFAFVKRQMKGLHRQSYIVTPSASEADAFKQAGLVPIVTDGTFFVSRLKEHAVVRRQMLKDEIFEKASYLLDRVNTEHRKLHDRVTHNKYPEMLFAASYQDGMMHALERALRMRGSGSYSDEDRINRSIAGYFRLRGEKQRNRKYSDIAYIDGYINALICLLSPPGHLRQVPLYYAFGAKQDLRTISAYLTFLRNNPQAHKASVQSARKFIGTLNSPGSVEIHHPPWLFW